MDFFRKRGIISSSEDSSSEEYSDSTKRSFECTFCRRGFTNAQALGGHMNIHRKDRAKGKQMMRLSSSHGNKYHNHHHHDRQNSILPDLDHDQYFDPMINSSMQYQSNFHVDLPQSSADFYNDHQIQHVFGLDLNLRINGSALPEDEVIMTSVWKNDRDVDLELRLGHDH